jgi:hypothetical protein
MSFEEGFDAIDTIGSYSEKSIAQIEQNKTMAIADLSNCVEKLSREIDKKSETARGKIEALSRLPKIDGQTTAKLKEKITDTSEKFLKLIFEKADNVIRKINTEVTLFVINLRKKMAERFREFKNLTSKASENTKKSLQKARLMFKTAKQSADNTESFNLVKQQAQAIIQESQNATKKLEAKMALAKSEIDKAVESALQYIKQALEEATNSIHELKRQATAKLDQITKQALESLHSG